MPGQGLPDGFGRRSRAHPAHTHTEGLRFAVHDRTVWRTPGLGWLTGEVRSVPKLGSGAFMKRTLIVTAGAILCAALWSAIPASAVTVWRVQQVPVPANASVNLQAVSCPATGVCFAVGYSTQVGTTIQSTLAERWSGGRWAILATPSPGP